VYAGGVQAPLGLLDGGDDLGRIGRVARYRRQSLKIANMYSVRAEYARPGQGQAFGWPLDLR
jgi:hypothetical protein